MPGVARSNLDIGDNALLVSGATSVIVENQPIAVESSANTTGSVVSSCSTTVFAEDKGVAREADTMSTGGLIASSSTTVFAD